MKIRELLEAWQNEASDPLTAEKYCARLPIYDAARLEALSEMFPGRTTEQLLNDLLTAALDELEGGFPYRRGDRVVERDEQGDPIFEDIGLGPRFHDLTRHHAARLKAGLREKDSGGQQA